MKKNIFTALLMCMVVLAGCSKKEQVTPLNLNEALALTEAQLNLTLSEAKSNISSAGYSYQGKADHAVYSTETAVYRQNDDADGTIITLVAMCDTVQFVSLDAIGNKYYGADQFKSLFTQIGEKHTLNKQEVKFVQMVFGSPTDFLPFDTIFDYNDALEVIPTAWRKEVVVSSWGNEDNGILMGTGFLQYSATVYINTLSAYFGDLVLAPGSEN